MIFNLECKDINVFSFYQIYFFLIDHLRCAAPSGYCLAYLLVMVEGILYTLWVEGLIFVLYMMYRLHKEIKQDEADYRDRFLDDM